MITPLTQDHLEEITALEAVEGDVRWSQVQFEKELENEFVRFFVNEEDKKIVAYAGYWKAGPEAQLTNLVVRPEVRRKGLAQHLLGFLMDCARSEGCETMTLEVRAANTKAKALYAKMGFVETGRRTKLYKDPEDDAVLMEKTL